MRSTEQAYFDLLSQNLRAGSKFNDALGFPVVSIVGPPGSGKTTSISLLMGFPLPTKARFYRERADRNPFLPTDSQNRGDTNWHESQLWFLHQYKNFMEDRRRSSLAFLDQDACIVTLIYNRRLLEKGLLEQDQYESQLEFAIDLERTHFSKGRQVFWLDADPDELAKRVQPRQIALPEPFSPATELQSKFSEIRQRFIEEIPGGVYPIDTTILSPDGVADRIYNTLKDEFKFSPG